MTNPPVQNAPQPVRLRLPGVASVFFVVSPLMILFGAFLSMVSVGSIGRVGDMPSYLAFQTMLATTVFWVGMAFLVTAVVLFGVRTIAQQQMDVLLQRDRERVQG